MVILILFCFSLTSCEVIELLKYSITGDIIDPAEGFSDSEEKGTFIYNDNKYILVREIYGECEIYVTEEHILLGYTSNFPIFPNCAYYTSKEENPSFIMGGASYAATFVYLREDLYNSGIVYSLKDSSFDFEFASAFVKTDTINYDICIRGNKYAKAETVDFYVKDIPEIVASK